MHLVYKDELIYNSGGYKEKESVNRYGFDDDEINSLRVLGKGTLSVFEDSSNINIKLDKSEMLLIILVQPGLLQQIHTMEMMISCQHRVFRLQRIKKRKLMSCCYFK